MADTIKAWQCIGCGRLEGPGQCVGICQDAPVDLVTAADYRALEGEARKLRGRVEALEEVVRRIALTRPKDGEWERTWIALQEGAKNVLGHADESYNHSSDDVDSPT